MIFFKRLFEARPCVTYLKQSKRALLYTLKNLQSVYKINNQDIQALADVIDEFADAYADDEDGGEKGRHWRRQQ